MLCLIAKLDELARERLAELRRMAAEKLGVASGSLYGHITLATYIGGDEDAFAASCRELLCRRAPFSVFYEKIEVLEESQIIVASPQNAGELARIHRDIAACWEAELDEWTQMARWQPHTTLLYKPGIDLYPLAAELAEAFSPFCVRVERLELSRVTDDGYRIIDGIDLR